jgi:S-adenosylmethionine/arginine decarboxylase-like enzyme
VLGGSVSVIVVTFTLTIRSINRTATTTIDVYTCSTNRRTGLFEAESLQRN